MSDSEEEVIMMAVALQRRRSRKRRFWVHETLLLREEYGEFHHLIQELNNDEERFFKYFRMGQEQFAYLLQKVSPLLRKQTTNFRKPIDVEQRLAICLRFLTTGDSYQSIAFSYRVGHSTVANIVGETCDALWEVLQPEVMPQPDKHIWLSIAQSFQEKWQFSHCIGAIDGKHVRIQAPNNSGSVYYNYKNYFSLVLLAVVDASYRFIAVDIGGYGSNSDGGILADSNFGKGLYGGKLDIPDQSLIDTAADIGPIPYVFVGDAAFPLRNNLMRPYPGRNLPEDQKIFNYRLSRARRVSENAFGILANRFRIYHRVMPLQPEMVTKVVRTSCVLHNFLMEKANVLETLDTDNDHLDGALRNIANVAGNRASNAALDLRQRFKNYFNSEAGEVNWQYGTVRRGLSN